MHQRGQQAPTDTEMDRKVIALNSLAQQKTSEEEAISTGTRRRTINQ